MVIGGDAAGMTAAANARRRRDDLEIVALERSSFVSYSACGIPYLVGGGVDDLDDLVVRTPQEFRDQFRIDVRIGHEATAIDLDARKVEIRNHLRDRTLSLGFDQLLIATGARPRRPDLPGIDEPWIVGVQTLADADHLLGVVSAGRCERVVVVGGGYIGLEMAEAFLDRGAHVALVEMGDHVMGTLDADVAAGINDALRNRGIDLRLSTPVKGFEAASDGRGGAVLTEAGDLPADLVILGLGVDADARLAAEAGVTVGPTGAVAVDRRQVTDADGVWAAGDCAESFHRVSQRPVHIALGTVANKQGRVAGINLAGGYATFPGVLGTAITKVCDTEIARTGLTEQEAAGAGFESVAALVDTTVQAGYLREPGTMAIKLVAERGTGRLLGGQIVGSTGAAKRIDTVATALWSELRVQDLIDLDLSYAPPFSGVWDAVQAAARQLLKQLPSG